MTATIVFMDMPLAVGRVAHVDIALGPSIANIIGGDVAGTVIGGVKEDHW